jgi:integrase
VDDGVVARNPFDAGSVRRPRVQATKAVPWDLTRVRLVSEHLPARYQAMVWLGAGCGHRQGELFGVAVDDVDFLGRVVHVRRQVRIIDGVLVFSLPKGGKQRSVPLPDSVGLRLSAHIAEHGTTSVTLPWRVPGGAPHTEALLFADGGALKRNDLNRVWRSARAGAGIAPTRDNGMHVLRHTAASAWLAAGVDVRTVAEFLGHSDPGFTLRVYTHLMPNAADRARKAMDVFFEVGAGSALDVPSDGAR